MPARRPAQNRSQAVAFVDQLLDRHPTQAHVILFNERQHFLNGLLLQNIRLPISITTGRLLLLL